MDWKEQIPRTKIETHVSTIVESAMEGNHVVVICDSAKSSSDLMMAVLMVTAEVRTFVSSPRIGFPKGGIVDFWPAPWLPGEFAMTPSIQCQSCGDVVDIDPHKATCDLAKKGTP